MLSKWGCTVFNIPKDGLHGLNIILALETEEQIKNKNRSFQNGKDAVRIWC